MPIAFVLLCQFVVLHLSGELNDYEQLNNERIELFGLAYSDQTKIFKLTQTLARKPDVLVIGTSRSMQIRSVYFSDSISFYNAGGVISDIPELLCVKEAMKNAAYFPKILLLPLDQNFFNEEISHQDYRRCEHYNRTLEKTRILSRSLTRFYSDMTSGKISLHKIFFRQDGVHGINAIQNHNGFRNDGSYQYGSLTESFKLNGRLSFKDEENKIALGEGRFKYGSNLDQSSIDILKTFIAFCNQNDIRVIGFLPPYASSIFDLMTKSTNYEYLSKLPVTLEKELTGFNVKIHDFSSLAYLGASDDEAIDGYHGSEVAYLRIVLELSRRESDFLKCTDQQKMLGMLEGKINSIQLMEN